MKAFKKTHQLDSAADRLQSHTEEALRSLLLNPVLDGNLIEEISLIGGVSKSINHGLGRNLRGWFLTRNSSEAVVWDEQLTNNMVDKTLILQSSDDCVISIWVF